MKNYRAIALLLSSSIGAMNEVPLDDAYKMQLNAPDQKVNSAQLAEKLEKCPNLQVVNIPGHVLEQLPVSFSAPNLIMVNLNDGQLNHIDTVKQLLTSCKNLQRLHIANNNLTTLNESQLPFHNNLKLLDCSHNEISEIDFPTFRSKTPSLNELNLSGCPLVNFKTQEVCLYDTVPDIQLNKTNLSDIAKKQIIAASKVIESCYEFNSRDLRSPRGGSIMKPFVAGGGLGMLIGFPMFMFTGIANEHYAFLNVGVLALVTFGSPLVAGSTLTYLCSIGREKPKDREATIFNPIFDTVPTYTEEEVTTRYQRFIRHFPYFFNACQRDETDDSESLPLTQVTTHD